MGSDYVPKEISNFRFNFLNQNVLNYVFKSIGSNSEFVSWLKNFKEVEKSLLIEIDPNLGAFVAKSSTQDRDFVLFSQISFEKAGYEPVSVPELLPGKRVLWGVMNILPKVIEIVGMFSNVEHTLNVNFDILYRDEQNTDFEYSTTDVELKSKNLTMKTYASSYKEFLDIPDKKFFEFMYVADSPSEVTVTPEIIKTVINVSGVMSQDANTSVLNIYSKDSEDGQSKEFHIADGSGKNSYDYIIGYSSKDKTQSDIQPVPIYRSNFIKATKGCDTEMTIIVGTQETDRVLVDYNNGNTKAVCSVIVR